MYMAGRLRTASAPSKTLMLDAVYSEEPRAVFEEPCAVFEEPCAVFEEPCAVFEEPCVVFEVISSFELPDGVLGLSIMVNSILPLWDSS